MTRTLACIQFFDIKPNYRIWKMVKSVTPGGRKVYAFKVGQKDVPSDLRYTYLGWFKSKKKALEFIKERESKYVVSFVDLSTSKSAPIETFGTREQAIKAAGLLFKASEVERALKGTKPSQHYRVNYSSSPDCSHFVDNQGLCHCCGILMDEGAAKESGYYQEEK